MSKKRAFVQATNDEVGQARMQLIKKALDKIEAAKNQGFYLEAIAILESLIADRLESLISIVDKETGFQTLGNSIKKLKGIGSKFDKNFMKFIKKECSKEGNNILELMSDPTKTTIARVVRPELKNSRFFGKTGTSNNGMNNWFVGFDHVQLSVQLSPKQLWGSNCIWL